MITLINYRSRIMQIAGASGHSVNQVISSTGIVSVGEIIMVDKSEGRIWMWIWPKSCIISYASAMLLLCFPYAFLCFHCDSPRLFPSFPYIPLMLSLRSPHAFPMLSPCFASCMLSLRFPCASPMFLLCLPYASSMLPVYLPHACPMLPQCFSYAPSKPN